MGNVDFKVFRSATELNDGRVMALRVPHGASMPRSEIDGYTDFVKIYGAKGLAYIKVTTSRPAGKASRARSLRTFRTMSSRPSSNEPVGTGRRCHFFVGRRNVSSTFRYRTVRPSVVVRRTLRYVRTYVRTYVPYRTYVRTVRYDGRTYVVTVRYRLR